MASLRRAMSAVQRDVVEQDGDDGSTSPSSFKASHLFDELPLRRTLTGLDPTLACGRLTATVPNTCLPRTGKPSERKKARQPWKKSVLHLFICFIVGSLVGITPFLSVGITRNFASEHQLFYFDVDRVTSNKQSDINSVMAVVGAVKDVGHLNSMNESIRVSEKDYVNYNTLTLSEDAQLAQQKLLIIVTPTYWRPFQAYYLNRLAHTLRSVPPPLLWIVVEMSQQLAETAEILRGTGIMYRHLLCQKNITDIKDQASHQRNVALAHIEMHQLDGIVYFADDHNIYALELFDQLREIRRFGTWPVAFLAGIGEPVVLEGPVCNGSNVIGWHVSERRMTFRRFHAHISGFAFNSSILWDPTRWHRPTPDLIRQLDTGKKGSQVSTLVELLVEDESQMEGLPIGCSKVMVWGMSLEASELSHPSVWSTPDYLGLGVEMLL